MALRVGATPISLLFQVIGRLQSVVLLIPKNINQCNAIKKEKLLCFGSFYMQKQNKFYIFAVEVWINCVSKNGFFH